MLLIIAVNVYLTVDPGVPGRDPQPPPESGMVDLLGIKNRCASKTDVYPWLI